LSGPRDKFWRGFLQFFIQRFLRNTKTSPRASLASCEDFVLKNEKRQEKGRIDRGSLVKLAKSADHKVDWKTKDFESSEINVSHHHGNHQAEGCLFVCLVSLFISFTCLTSFFGLNFFLLPFFLVQVIHKHPPAGKLVKRVPRRFSSSVRLTVEIRMKTLSSAERDARFNKIMRRKSKLRLKRFPRVLTSSN
jgi:hypothetical protein